MIEQNILKWLELGDSIQKIDIYNKKFNLLIYKVNYILSKHIHFSQYFYLFVYFLFFGQIWELNLIKVNVEGDGILKIIKNFEKLFLFNKLITNSFSYKIIEYTLLFIFLIFLILLFCNTILIMNNKKVTFLIFINSLMNVLTINYLNGPSLRIFFYSMLCLNQEHIFAKIKCSFENLLFSITVIVCLIFSILMVIIVISMTLFINDIGCINGSNVNSKINSNYSSIIVIYKIILFFFAHILELFLGNNIMIVLIYNILFLLSNIFISIYTYRKVYYYNKTINTFHHYGWYYSTWLSICVFFKMILGIKDTTLFVIIGFILITFGTYFNDKYRQFKLLTELNILEGNSLKDIEVYNEILLELSKNNSHKSRTLIAGVVKRFEEYLVNSVELNEHYYNYLNDKHLQKKFSSYNELKILTMISIIYSYNIEKSKDSNDLILNQCYFLINKCKNPALVISLSTKIKSCTYIQSYYKYVLMEEIKEYLIKKLNKSTNKLALKNVQISCAILYNQYVDLFKIKIYDATCSQIEYFDVLRNNMTTAKTTENFLKIGEDILSLRQDIIDLWEKIIVLNPFSNESEVDYMIYLDTILQDDVLVRSETKRYNTLKAEKLPERNNPYYMIFNQELSAVLLADGYSHSGKIFYATPNFPSLFMFTGKEILNTSIDDLLPDVIQSFHRFLIEDAIKFSNLIYIFKNQRNVLLKGKNGLIFNIYLYVKPSPDLTFGLIYFIYVQKIQEPNFIIILDENFIINGFTEMASIGSNFTMNNNYGLSQFVNGYHICSIIPEILLQMNYDIKTKTFAFSKTDIDLKGYLYPIHNLKEIEGNIEKILEVLKERKISDLNNDNKYGYFEEYDEYIKLLTTQHPKPYSIFYRIEIHNFLGGKYKYYRIYITNDLLSGNETPIEIQSNNLMSDEDINPYKESLNPFKNRSKIREIEESNITTTSNNQGKKNKNSNYIRLKTKLNRQSKILFKDELENLNKELNNKEINLNDDFNEKRNLKSNNDKNQFININQSMVTSSILTNSNIESAEFNKLKNEIINKNDSFYLKLIKYLSYIYIIIIVILIIYDYISTKKVVSAIIEFLEENLYFTHTKISDACVYNSAFNLKLVKYKVIQNENCPNLNCTSFYTDLLQKCITDVRVQKYDISSFYPDYQVIFSNGFIAELLIYQSHNVDHLNLDIDSYLNLMIAHGLKIIANISDYFGNETENQLHIEILDIYLRNLLMESLKFFYSDYSGFSGEEKEKKCYKVSYNSPIRIILSLTSFFITCFIIFNLVCKINSMEIFFLDKLINFSSSNFDDYLKNLEDLKKKFREDNNDEDDKNADEDIGDDIDGKNENNSKKDDNNLNYKNKKNTNAKQNSKKKKNQQSKIQQKKMKKKKIMSEYFIKYNIYFGIKIGIIFLFSNAYFLATIINAENMRKGYKQFDATLEQVNQVFFESFEIFLILKEQIVSFYDSGDRNKLNIPKDSEIKRPKFGNALMNIIGNSKYEGESLDFINKLFNDNACEILTQDSSDYEYCENLFSSILTKGIEQATVQMSIILSNCIDELVSLKKYNNFNNIFLSNTSYYNYEIFMGYYMYNSFILTQTTFKDFRNKEKASVNKSILVNLFINGIFFLFLIIFSIYFIYDYKNVENSFLNFIGILPDKFISDDEDFYKSIFKLGQYFY